jgi:hypothetical protein
MSQRYPGDPRKRLNRAFALLSSHVTDPEALGCGMANAAVESNGHGRPARQAIEAHKAKLHAKLAELCVTSGASEPELLAEQLFLLIQGAQATLILGVHSPARNAGPAAATLIDARVAAAALPS